MKKEALPNSEPNDEVCPLDAAHDATKVEQRVAARYKKISMKKLFTCIIIIFISNAVQSQTGNVGIGTTSPKAKLHVADSNVVFAANGLALAVPGIAPVNGAGRRMMWYADKAAFRAGYASDNEWDNANVGKYTFATGYGATASADFSAAIGLNVRATGTASIAIGNNAQATADYTLAMGAVAFANKTGANAIGGQAFAFGPYATAIGYNITSKSFAGMVTGTMNDVSDNPFDTAAQTDRIFQIGNGYYDATIDDEVRRNALTILRNGKTGIGTTLPDNILTVKGNTNITDSLSIGTTTAANRLSVNGNANITGNLGIGITNAGYPLNFPATTGDKISLYGSSGNHYGFGIQGGLMQMYTDAAAANIAFGYGSSSSFNERVRIFNSGTDVMRMRGRLVLQNDIPPDVNQGPGIWIYKPDNSAQLVFFGAAGGNLLGITGGPLGWGWVYDANTSNTGVGIGAITPQYQLDVGGRIRIRHRGVENAGIWLNNDLNNSTAAFMGLQNNSQVGFYGTGGIGWGLTMNTTNGSLSVNGSAGNNKNILMSNGAGSAPVWTAMGNVTQSYLSGVTSLMPIGGATEVDLPNNTMNITVDVPSRIFLYSRTNTWKVCLAGACQSKWQLRMLLNGTEVKRYGVDGVRYAAENSSPGTDATLGPEIMDVNPGIHTITFKALNQFNDPYITLSVVAVVIPR